MARVADSCVVRDYFVATASLLLQPGIASTISSREHDSQDSVTKSPFKLPVAVSP